MKGLTHGGLGWVWQMGTLKTMLTERDWSPEALEEEKRKHMASLKEAVKVRSYGWADGEGDQRADGI
jgi:hypothetical protein